MAEKLMSEGTGIKVTLPETTLKEFSLAAWLQGREQATRTIRIYGSLGLFGERERLGHELEAARASKNEALVAELLARIDELTVDMQEDYVDFRLQGLTQSRRGELLKELEKSDVEDPETLALMMLSEYVVEPEGVTADALMGLADWDPTQTNELVVAMNQLNSQVPNIGGTRPF